MDKSLFVYSEEVANALKNQQPVVALESTIIAHGMPYPENLKTALSLEKLCRETGAVPATISIAEGKVLIGMTEPQLIDLAQSTDAMKVSTRDVAFALASGKLGATTVAATSLLASKAGIKVFVTGGIGGVHREYSETMDVSNDLVELGRIPIVVVCAGAKSILDLPRTVEYLETEGVLVLGWQTDQFPAFYTRSSGLSCYKATGVDHVAKVMHYHFDALGLQRAILLCVPVPMDYEISFEENNRLTETALKEATSSGVKGKEITPFLLKRISQLSEKKSLNTNIKLVENNTRVGVQIAVEYFKKLRSSK